MYVYTNNHDNQLLGEKRINQPLLTLVCSILIIFKSPHWDLEINHLYGGGFRIYLKNSVSGNICID